MKPIIELVANMDERWYVYEKGKKFYLQIAEYDVDWKTCSKEMNKEDYLSGIEKLLETGTCKIPIEDGELKIDSDSEFTTLELKTNLYNSKVKTRIKPKEFGLDNHYSRMKSYMEKWDKENL